MSTMIAFEKLPLSDPLFMDLIQEGYSRPVEIHADPDDLPDLLCSLFRIEVTRTDSGTYRVKPRLNVALFRLITQQPQDAGRPASAS